MQEQPEPFRYCPVCGGENPLKAVYCGRCASALEGGQPNRRDAAIILNELGRLAATGLLPAGAYEDARDRYLPFLKPRRVAEPQRQPAAPPAPRSVRQTPSPRPRPPAPTREPRFDLLKAAMTWTADQQANLLLYLGAFLIVVATLVLVGSSQREIGPAGNMTLLVLGTGAFLVAGLVCLRGARVRQAGTVFVVVSGLMFPLNFLGAYVFFYEDSGMDPAALWLGGSLASALFYGAVSFLGIGRWYPVPSAAGLTSAVVATRALLDAPLEALPAAVILLGLLLCLPALFPFRRFSEVMGSTWYWTGHAAAGGSLLAGFYLLTDHRQPELVVNGPWLWLGASLASLAFCSVIAWRRASASHGWGAVISLPVLLGTALNVAGAPYALYAPAFALLGLLLTAPAIVSLGRAGGLFGLQAVVSGYVVSLAALSAAFLLRQESGGAWYLLATLAICAALCWLQALFASDARIDALGLRAAAAEFLAGPATPVAGVDERPAFALAALTLTGLLPPALVYALGVDFTWYGPAASLSALGFLAAALPLAPRWAGSPFPGWLAIAAASLSWTALVFGAEPASIAADGFIAAFVYLALGRLHQSRGTLGDVQAANANNALVPAAGAALSLAFFFLLETTQLVDTDSAVEVAYAYFGLSLCVAAVAMSSRWWWVEIRPHLYAVSLLMGLGVFLAAAGYVDKAWLVLSAYAAAALAATLWERDERGLVVAVGCAFFALPATWRYVDARDAYAPWLSSGLGAALLIAAVRIGARRWRLVLQRLGLASMALAPIAAFAGLLVLAARGPNETPSPDSRLLVQVMGVLAAAGMFACLRGLLRLPERDLAPAAGLLLLGAGALTFPAFEADFAEQADHALALHVAAAAFLVMAAWIVERSPAAVSATRDERTALLEKAIVAGILVCGAWLAVDAATYYSLSAVLAIDTGDSAAISSAFFALVWLQAAVAVAARWTRPALRLPSYCAAAGTSLLALSFSGDSDGRLTLFLFLLAAGAYALSVWEREPRALVAGALYTAAGVFAGRAYLDLDQAFLPPALSAVGFCFLAASLGLWKLQRWPLALLALALAFGALAPAAGGAVLVDLADPRGYVGATYFIGTRLFESIALSVALLGLMIAMVALAVRTWLGALLASAVLMSALLMEIGHFRPENPQAYSLPLGLYFIAVVLVATRYGRLPSEVSPWVERLYAFGPSVIMAPSFLQSLQESTWQYGVLLLLESLAFLTLAVFQRRTWLLSAAVSFVVANGLHYLFFERTLPTWAVLSLAGVLLMLAGTAILSARDRWPAIQEAVLRWWEHPPPRPRAGAI